MTTIVTLEDFRRIVELQSSIREMNTQMRRNRSFSPETITAEKMAISEQLDAANQELVAIAQKYGIELVVENHFALVKGRYLLSDNVELSPEDHRQYHTVRYYGVYARRSPRHKWDIVTNNAGSEYRQYLIAAVSLREMNTEKYGNQWPDSQIGLWTHDYYYQDGTEIERLPSNHPMNAIYGLQDEVPIPEQPAE